MHKYARQIRRAIRWVSARLSRCIRWWLQYDRRYGLRWRAGNGLAVLLVFSAVALPVIQNLAATRAYALNANTIKLVGTPDAKLSQQLKYDGAAHTYRFNTDAIKNDSANPAAAMQALVGTASGKGGDKSLYALDVPQDMSKGVTYHDINSGISFSLTPQFAAREGRQVDGHLVFPLDGNKQAIYTLKNNGLKEDIVVQKVAGDVMSFAYQLHLPKTLQAKVIPDSGGAIGIYAADPSLFGNISYATDADRAAVEKARENGEKTHLIFGLPAPVIKTPDGNQVGAGRFSLQGDQLSVIASGLSGIKGPVTIDPSVVVTSTSDFQTGNMEGNIDFGTSGQATRGALNGGVVDATGWTAGGNLGAARYSDGVAAYNGFLYAAGGYTGGAASAEIDYVSISSGSIGTWTTTGQMPQNAGRTDEGLVAYNGYLYVMGGWSDTLSATLSDVWYAPINSNGSLGTWTQTSGLASGRDQFGTAAYNGYMYIAGGCTTTSPCGTNLSDVQYAAINANGTLGPWKATTSFATARYGLGAAAYNGYFYIMGGCTTSSNGSIWICTGGTYQADVQYAPINSDGTLGTFTTTTALSVARNKIGVTAYNGYMYVMGGYHSASDTACNGTSSNFCSDVQYAPINSNGTVGPWRATTNFSTARAAFGVTAYQGYLYLAGGSTGSASSNTQYAKIDSAGQLNSWSALSPDTHSITARALACGASNNKYLYAIGGSTSDTANDNVTTISVAPVGGSGATTAVWNETTAGSLPTARGMAGCAISNNNILYVVGGQAGTPVGARDGAALYASLNLSTGAVGAFTSSAHTITNDVNGTFRPYNNGVFVYNNFLYSVGGGSSSGPNATDGQGVFYAPLNTSTGAIGTWVQTSSLSQNYAARAYERVGNHLYAIGGQTFGPTTNQSGVETATINSNGTVSAWTTTSITALPSVLAYAQATTINGCIYIVGGETAGGTSLNNVYFNCPASDGTLPNAWKAAPNIPTATTDTAVTSNGGYLYMMGGWTTAATGVVNVTAANNGGSGQVGAWTTQSGQLPTTMESFGSTVNNGFAYMAGGRTNGGGGVDINNTYYATINSNGSLGAFTSGGNLPTPVRQGSQMLASNGFLYVMGGNNFGFSTYFANVFSASINANGSPGAWGNLAASPLPSGRTLGCATSYNGYLYAMGGFNSGGSFTDVLYAQVGATGALNGGAAWGTTTSLPISDAGYCFVANGYMYVLGDFTVYSAPVNGNGTLGSWTTVSSPPNSQGGVGGLPASSNVGVSNGFLYMIAGCTDVNGDCTSTATSAIQFVPIEPNGTLGTWQTSTALPNAIGAGGGFAYNGYLYQFGGYDGGVSYSDTLYYAPISTIARTGQYSKLIDIGSANNITSVTYNGILPAGSSVTYKAAGADGVFGATSSAVGTVSGTGGCIGTQTNTRYLLLSATLSDATAGVDFFADPAASDPDPPAQLNDITVNYTYFHPPPNTRLRGGQTLQTGSLTPFDTCLSSITHLQSATFTPNGAASTSVAVTLPSVNAGHLLVATVDWGLSTGTPACSDTLGSSWTTIVIGHDVTHTKSVAVCYAITTGSGANTVTAGSLGSTAVKSIAVDEYSGILISGTTAQLDGSATSSVNTATTGASNSITTTVAGDLIVGVVGITNADPVISATGSFALRASTGQAIPHVAHEDFVQAAAGSVNASWSFNGTSSTYLSGVIAFKAAPRQ